MTRLNAIEILGDRITELDVAIGSLLPNDPNHQFLQDQRLILDDRQRTLSKQAFEDDTAAFQSAADALAKVNTEIKGTLRRIDQINLVIRNVTRLVNAATSLIGTFAAPVLRAAV